ncbi:MAG: monovalent cation/H+ antiporter subunit A [Gammaproteobacteria bacterium]|nr:MAG: monovalent cation/H+ antiporter subunit A [Gammaproteobacteria bacterium]
MLASLVAIPFLGALIPLLFKSRLRRDPAPAAALVAGLALAFLVYLTAAPFRGETLTQSWQWLPSIGLDLAFRFDGLGMLFAYLIVGIGLLVILYARYYLKPEDATGRFYAFLLLFMGAMLGVVLSENLLLLLIFWELTSLVSFLLIGYWTHDAQARQGARLALLITGAGGLALFAGILLLGQIVGSFSLSDVLLAGPAIKADPLYGLVLVLILLGAFTKSAQFPFHFWLPHAMAAPTPISAYLHSATMVKLGVFLLARLFPVLSGTDMWFTLVGGAGVITLVMGAYHALWQHDIKGMLAYSTISNLGLITLLFGLGTSLGAIAGVFHIMNHAVFKASLFMATGVIDHETGSRDMRKINGLFKYMPYTAVLAIVSAAAMAGVPLLNGFISKEMFFQEAVDLTALGYTGYGLPAAAVIAGIGSVAYSSRFIHDVFFNGEPVGLTRTPREPPRWMKFPIEILVVVVIAVGVAPAYTVGPILDVVAGSVLQRGPPEFSLSLWHGFNLAFMMSILALAGGVIVYALRHRIYALHDRVLPPVSGRNVVEALLHRIFRATARINGLIENGSLQRYLFLLVLSALVVGVAAFRGQPLLGPLSTQTLDTQTLALGIILMVGAIGTVVFHRTRFVAVVVIGVVGLMVSLMFVRFSGPDIAMTQLLIEFTTIVLILLALFFLPWTTPVESGVARRVRDAILGVLTGIGVGALSYAMFTRPLRSISEFFLVEAKPGGGGTNVVNVILVDFRGFDTLGEITVLGIAAVGIYAMLANARVQVPRADMEGRPWAWDRHPAVLAVIARVLLPLALLVAVYLFLRGHNLPGGGFIAALVAASALILMYLSDGSAMAHKRIGWRYRMLVGVGILIAAGTGLGSLIFGYPFLTTSFAYVTLPVIGEFELATAMLFDLGVFVAVVATVMLILAYLGRLNAPLDSVPTIRWRRDREK